MEDHFPPPVDSLLDCKYGWCGRTGVHAFKREDHLHEHYRKVHMKENECPKKSRGKGGSKKNISARPEKFNRSVQVDEIDEKPALNYKSIPSPASPESSGLMAEAVAPLESQQPPKKIGSPPDQETGLKTSIADANVETLKPCLYCHSQVFVGPFQQKDLQRSGDIGMESFKTNEWTSCSDDDSMLERSEGSILNGPGAPLECKDRHATEMISDGDQKMVTSTSNYSIDDNLAILECGVLAAFQTREAGLHDTLLKVDWDVLAFMKDQFHDNEYPNTTLGSVVTISGSVQHAQATTCAEYVKQNWAAHGLGILGLYKML